MEEEEEQLEMFLTDQDIDSYDRCVDFNADIVSIEDLTKSMDIEQQQIEAQEGTITKIRQDEIERNLEMFCGISLNDKLRYDLLDSAVDDALECWARHAREPDHPNYFKVALMEWFQCPVEQIMMPLSQVSTWNKNKNGDYLIWKYLSTSSPFLIRTRMTIV